MLVALYSFINISAHLAIKHEITFNTFSLINSNRDIMYFFSFEDEQFHHIVHFSALYLSQFSYNVKIREIRIYEKKENN